MSDTRIHVAIGERAYDIRIGMGALGRLDESLAACGPVSHAVIIADSHVAEHAQTVRDALPASVTRRDLLVFPAGESSKSVAEAERLWGEMLRVGADRRTLVIAVGGGVVGDLAGFIAATFTRGLRLLQIPTTLLAQVDSSVGGKVGVNLPGAKNMVGAFWQPSAVVIDLALLATLPDREYRSGLAEVVKYGVILDAELFERLERDAEALSRRDPGALEPVIARCCRLKADVVERDEREETGLRAVLNYGHTFAHALEAETDYGTFLHGEAVSVGMLCASRLAESLGRVPAELTERQRRLLATLGLPVEARGLDRERLLAAMAKDKKVAHGRLRFVLPDRLGHVELVGDVAPELVRRALEAFC